VVYELYFVTVYQVLSLVGVGDSGILRCYTDYQGYYFPMFETNLPSFFLGLTSPRE